MSEDCGGDVAFKKGEIYYFDQNREGKSEVADCHEMDRERDFDYYFTPITPNNEPERTQSISNKAESAGDEKPILEEVFACNGEHSHWKLIDTTTGETLWETPEDENLPASNGQSERAIEIVEKHFADAGESLTAHSMNLLCESIVKDIKKNK